MKIEYRELESMGANEKQLETYSNSDPLTITKVAEDVYDISGIVEAYDLSAQGVLDLLDVLAEEE